MVSCIFRTAKDMFLIRHVGPLPQVDASGEAHTVRFLSLGASRFGQPATREDHRKYYIIFSVL